MIVEQNEQLAELRRRIDKGLSLRVVERLFVMKANEYALQDLALILKGNLN